MTDFSTPKRDSKPGAELPEDEQWARGVLEKLSYSLVAEQRKTRRWGIFFKLLLVAYLAVLLVLYIPADYDKMLSGELEYTALVDIDGVIGPDHEASADLIATGLREAFEDETTKGIVLRINSPGGSPVQSDYVYKEIKRLRGEYPDIPVYAVVVDICASGGYYIASAADKIFVNENSLVGSIGVRMDGFGFVDSMQKLGIERRLLTAGEHKGFLDPFLPQQESDVAHVRTLLADIHQQFINTVKAGRGDRLKNDEEIFNGYIWTGSQARALGLVDDFGSAGQVARDVIGAEEVRNFTYKRDVFEQFAERLGASLAAGISRVIASASDSIRLQ